MADLLDRARPKKKVRRVERIPTELLRGRDGIDAQPFDAGARNVETKREGNLLFTRLTGGEWGEPINLEAEVLNTLGGGVDAYPRVEGDALYDQVQTLDTFQDRQKLVRTLSDLPDPINGRICLGDFEYVLINDLSSPYPICFPGAGDRSTWKTINRSTWTYTGTGACFEDPDAEGDIELVGLTQFEAPNGNMFDITAVTGAWSFQALSAARFRNCNALGTLNMNGVSEFNTFFGTFADYDQGLVVNDSAFFELNTMFMFGNNQPGCVHVTMQGTGTSGVVAVVDNTFSLQSNETAFDFKSELEPLVESITLHGNNRTGVNGGDPFAAGSLDFDTPKVFSRANSFFEDSKPDILSYIQGNVLETVITDPDTPVRVNAVWQLAGLSQFEFDSAGRFTYKGINDLATPITISLTTTVGVGNTDALTFYIYKNGVQVPASATRAEHSTQFPSHITMVWGQNLSTDDYIEIWVENNDDASNVTVSSGQARLN